MRTHCLLGSRPTEQVRKRGVPPCCLTQFEKIMKAFCDKKSVDINQVGPKAPPCAGLAIVHSTGPADPVLHLEKLCFPDPHANPLRLSLSEPAAYQVRFVFDGNRVERVATPHELEMEDGGAGPASRVGELPSCTVLTCCNAFHAPIV